MYNDHMSLTKSFKFLNLENFYEKLAILVLWKKI